MHPQGDVREGGGQVVQKAEGSISQPNRVLSGGFTVMQPASSSNVTFTPLPLDSSHAT